MRIKLQLNIGHRDQLRFDLPSGAEGDVLEVPEHIAKRFITKGWAVEVEDVSDAAPEKKSKKDSGK
jgi:hypothetical protein